mgnify:CR=1 FL=1
MRPSAETSSRSAVPDRWWSRDRIRGWPTPPGGAFDPQWVFTIGIDLLAFSTLHFLQAAGLNYSPLYALPVLMASILGSITLALAVTGLLALPTPLIEFLIPVTIVLTCIENILVRDPENASVRAKLDSLPKAGSLSANAEARIGRLEGWLARMFYVSLYRMHQMALYGMFRTAMLMLGSKIGRGTEPRLKLH